MVGALAATRLEHFPIDLSFGRRLIGEIDYITPEPVLDLITASPTCACYRDLADLLFLIRATEFTADNILVACGHVETIDPSPGIGSPESVTPWRR